MGLVKGKLRKKRAARTKSAKVNTGIADTGSQQVVSEAVSESPDSAIEHSIEASAATIQADPGAAGVELSHLLLQFTGDNDLDSSIKPNSELEDCTRFQIVEEVIDNDRPADVDAVYVSTDEFLSYQADVNDEADSRNDELSDFSQSDTTPENEPIHHQDEIPCEASAAKASRDDLTMLDLYTSDTSDEGNKDSSQATPDQNSRLPQDDRRKQAREDRSDLVWLEYFNSSLESTGKEATRTENIGAGGMRVAIKAAPADVERVTVSYPYRGFESCAIVRNRYQGEDGQEHLCLEFADRTWVANANSATVEHHADHAIQRRKILLADDDATFRKILGDILTRAGYDVVLAEDGEKALEKAESEKPDLVITDGLMPRLHGFQVCKAVKELHPQTKVIMLTAIYTSPNYRWEAHSKFQVDEIVTKPCQIADLLSKIEKHLPALGHVA